MEKWNEDGKFVMFNKTNVIKQISHTDNQVIWFTDNSFLYPMNYHLVKPITLKQITEIINRLKNSTNKKVTNQNIRFKCEFCGRCFIKKIPHKCVGGYRKRGLTWEQFTLPVKQAKS